MKSDVGVKKYDRKREKNHHFFLTVQKSVFPVFLNFFSGSWSVFHKILTECVTLHDKMIFAKKIGKKEKIEIFWRKITFSGRVLWA
jgi:hypothetical protein